MTEEAVKEAPQYSEAEQAAIDNGWNPDKEAVEAEGKKWVSAEEYNERGSFFKKINEQKKEIENLKQTVDQVSAHMKKVAKMEREKAQREYENRIADLEREKRQALDESDHDRVIEIDRELRNTTAPKDEGDGWSQEVVDKFKDDNPWYKDDAEMREFADDVGIGYNARHPDASPQQVFDEILKRVKKAYPEKFENQNRAKASAVEGDTMPPPKSGKISVKDLTPDERQVFQNFDRLGIFKNDSERQNYLKEVVNLRQ